ncbi:protease HtpX [Rudaea sp.]|uniref:protease HtpX n=1 Tax=Rudaea sp. TaxID=2136325 RepID=UPI002ED08B34
MLRIVLFLLTNLAIMLVLSVVASIFGLDRWAYAHSGINLAGMLVFCALFGVGGSLISLLLSKTMAKMSVGAQVIAQPRNASEQWLFNTVAQHAKNAGIGMPEIAVYDAPEMNAFATGASKNHALVAVSTGLLQSMNRDEVSAVLGHEISHVANGDMVTLALIQGVVNTFVMFLARVLGSVIDNAISGNRDNREGGYGIGYFVITMVLQLVLGVLATMIVMWFSRWREFRADAGGAQLGGRANMISALRTLSGDHGDTGLPKALVAFGIAGDSGIARLFMSHPPIAERIAALQRG